MIRKYMLIGSFIHVLVNNYRIKTCLFMNFQKEKSKIRFNQIIVESYIKTAYMAKLSILYEYPAK